jgi:hypothetical protein
VKAKKSDSTTDGYCFFFSGKGRVSKRFLGAGNGLSRCSSC